VKVARQPVRRRRTPNHSLGAWSIVLLDGAPIRRRARHDYDKALRDLDAAKAEAERFETEDKPQFEKWLSANFGALLTEIRELQEKLFQAQGLVNEVQQEFYYGNYRSITNAYKKVVKRRNHPEEFEPENEALDEEEEQFRRDFEEVFGATEDEFWQKIGGASPGRSERKPAAKTISHLKEIYRNLVRRLHPDKGAHRSAKEIEWWHQVQEAYESGNLEQLELILTLVEIEEKGAKEASVSVLTQLTEEFKKSIKAMKRKLAAFRKDIAWNFSRLTDLSGLFRRTQLQLQSDRDQLLWVLQKYERQIRSWETAAAVSGKRVRARRTSWQDEEWF